MSGEQVQHEILVDRSTVDLNRADLLPGKATIRSYLSVKFWEARERWIVTSLALTNFADQPLNPSKPIESGVNASRYKLTIAQLSRVLEAKEQYYGSSDIETAKTLIYLARACYFRENESQVLESHSPLRLGHQCLKRVIDLILAGHLDERILDIYASHTGIERKLGARFSEIKESAPACFKQAVIAAPLAFEYAAGSRLDYRRDDAVKMQQNMLQKLGFPHLLLTNATSVEHESVSSAFAGVKALLTLDLLDDRFYSLMKGLEMWAFSLNSPSYMPQEVMGKRRADATAFLAERQNLCETAQRAFPQLRKVLEDFAPTMSTELFKLGILESLQELIQGNYIAAQILTDKAVSEAQITDEARKCAAEYATLMGGCALRFRERDWETGADALYQMQEQLVIFAFGEGSSARAEVLNKRGYLYSGTSRYLERVVHSRFGQGDPFALIDPEELEKAIGCFILAESIYRSHGNEAMAQNCAREIQGLARFRVPPPTKER